MWISGCSSFVCKAMDSQCILGITRVRKVFICLGFVFLFLWILFGNYDTGRLQRTRSVENELQNITDNSTKLNCYTSNDEVDVSIICPWIIHSYIYYLYIIIYLSMLVHLALQCSSVHHCHGDDMKCEFVKKVPACKGEGGFIHYFEFVYCRMPSKLVPLSMVILVRHIHPSI